MRPRKAPRTPEISRCRSPPRSGQSQPAPSTEAPPVDEQRSTKSARAKVLGKNSQKGPPAGKRAKKERTGGGSPRRPRAFWGPGAAFWGFLGAWGAVGKKAGNGPNRTRLIEIGLPFRLLSLVLSCLLTLYTAVMSFEILFPFGLWVFEPDWLLNHSQLV